MSDAWLLLGEVLSCNWTLAIVHPEMLLVAPIQLSLYDGAASRSAVRTDRTWTSPTIHLCEVDLCTFGALEERGMKVMTEGDIYQVIFPTYRACGSVLSAHLTRPDGPPDETVERAWRGFVL